MKRILTLLTAVIASALCIAGDEDYFQEIQCEDTCSHVHGIDLSHYQGTVFWETVGADANVSYVYIKATEGGENIDERYLYNIELARKNKLKVGSYHFFRPKVATTVQLANFRAQCRPEDQDLIPMIDIESRGGLSTEAFLDSLTKFLKLVELTYGQKPLLYTFTNFYNRYLQNVTRGYKLMIAQYTEEEPELKDDADITLWQYSAKGKVRGINGYVDKSRFMGNHSIRELTYMR